MAVWNTKEYRAWIDMRRRCSNPARKAYARYGARGISVCAEWDSSFDSFIRDVGYAPSAKHSLERRDNDGMYEPGNVVWATPRDQANNTATNRLVSIEGEVRTASEWARLASIHPATLRDRLRRGHDAADAVLRPSRGWRREVEYAGRRLTVAQWSAELNVPISTINYRLRNGFLVDGTVQEDAT